MCFSCCTVVHGAVLCFWNHHLQRAILCCVPTQVTRDDKIIFIRLLHGWSLKVQQSNELQSRVSGRALVPEHHSVVGPSMAAEDLNFFTTVCDELRRGLKNLKTQTGIWQDCNTNNLVCTNIWVDVILHETWFYLREKWVWGHSSLFSDLLQQTKARPRAAADERTTGTIQPRPRQEVTGNRPSVKNQRLQ